MSKTTNVPIIKLVENFMLSKTRNAWLTNKYMKVYVRKARHMINGQIESTFDVANITVHPKYQTQGYFKELMLYVETLGLIVYVESINNPELKTMLLKHGYTLDSSGYNAHKHPQLL